MNSLYYRWGMIGFSRGLLWLAAILAVLGWPEKNVMPSVMPSVMPLSFSNENAALALSFALIVTLLYFLAETENGKKLRVRNLELRLSLIPVLLTGLFFPILWLPFYCLGMLLILYGIVPVCKKWMLPFRRTSKGLTQLQGDDAEEEIIDNSITQQIVRRYAESGAEQVEGTFVIQFSEQELTKTLHFPFCPSFMSLPKIDTFLLTGENCKINIVKPQPFGVRVDVKRTSRSPEQVRILVIASES